MTLTLHLHEDDGKICCQFGIASLPWTYIGRWFDAGCRDLVVSDTAPAQPRGHQLFRDPHGCPFTFWSGKDRAIPVLLLPPDGHPAINGCDVLWIWPLVPLPVRDLASHAPGKACAAVAA